MEDKEPVKSFKIVGKNVAKVDGLSLTTGSAEFTDDVFIPEMLEIKLLLSPYPHARIKRIDTTEAEQLPGVAGVFCFKNVPRVIHTTAGQGFPEPSPYDTFIFDQKVRFVGDRVAAVAAENATIAEEALKLIKVEYEELPAVLDPRLADQPGAPIIHDEPEAHYVIPVPYEPEHNIAARVEARVGDLKKGLAEADVVIEQEFITHYTQHCPLEPHIVITYFDSWGKLHTKLTRIKFGNTSNTTFARNKILPVIFYIIPDGSYCTKSCNDYPALTHFRTSQMPFIKNNK